MDKGASLCLKLHEKDLSPDAKVELLKRDDTNSPRGTIEMDPATRDIVQTAYIRRVERESGGVANVELDSITLVKDPWKELNPAK